MSESRKCENNECTICGNLMASIAHREPHPSDKDRRKINVYWCLCCGSFPEKREL